MKYYLQGIFNDFIVEPAIIHIKKKLAKCLSCNNHLTILDICQETGIQSDLINKFQTNVFSLDIEYKLLEYAHSKNHKIKYTCANATSLPYKNDIFDIVIFSFALHDKPSEIRYQIVNEAKRVLKFNGKIFFADFTQPTNQLKIKSIIGSAMVYINELFTNHNSMGINFYCLNGLDNLLRKTHLFEFRRINFQIPNASIILTSINPQTVFDLKIASKC